MFVDFTNLAIFDPELSDLLIEEPDDTVKAAQLSIRNIDVPLDVKHLNLFRIRFFNLPLSQCIAIKNLRSKHMGKFIQIEGIVRQKTPVRPQVTLAKFECPSCGHEINVPQLDEKFREPTKCGCGRKGKFRLLTKQMVDAQRIVVEEASDNLDGGEQPKRLNVLLLEDLASPMTERKTNPGARIALTGILKEVPIILKSGGQSVRFDIILESNYIEGKEEEFGELDIDPEEEKEIIQLSKDPELIKKIVHSAAPSIYGHEFVKEALILQMVGGVRKGGGEDTTSRGDIHVLLIGDPGSGKSQLLDRMSIIAPKSKFVSGKGASGVGLTAAVVRDEFMGGFSLEAGALVLANKGMVFIDELDKLSKDDINSLHEAMEQQKVSIAKANIQAQLVCQTTILASANPKFGRFDPYEMLAKQIDLPPTILSRFDMIFPFRDIPDREKDDNLAQFILNRHMDKALNKEIVVEFDTKFLRKYIAYAKNKKPHLTHEAIAEIKNYYVKMRMSGGEEGGVSAIPISARQLEGLVRLSEASAKIKLKNQIDIDDAKKAIEIVDFALRQIGLDPKTGKIDLDRITSNLSASERGGISVVKRIINELEKTFNNAIPVEEIIQKAGQKKVDEDQVNEAIEKLKKKGDIYEPKKNIISKL